MDKKRDALTEELGQYGYELFQPAKRLNPEHVLGDLLKQNEMRLLEGFPVVLTNVLRQHHQLYWEKREWKFENEFDNLERTRLVYLLAFTLYLINFYKLPGVLSKRVEGLMGKLAPGKAVLQDVTHSFDTVGHVDVGDKEFATQRLKDHFENYVVHGAFAASPDAVQRKKKELKLELLFSQLFTPRQKDLLRKRDSGELLTKTEREYYSRVLKKRLVALANDNVHAYAKRLLNS